MATSGADVRVLLCLLLLALPLATAWNLTVAASHPRLFIRIGPHLSGVTTELPLSWSLSSLVDDSLQKALASRATEALPIRPLLIKLNNQLRYALFGEMTAPGIVRGADHQLVEEGYLTEYCARTEGLAESRAHDTLPILQRIQNYYRSRGAVFVYLVTPSKVAHIPEDFVTQFPCPSTERARADFIPEYVRLLRDGGINVIDAATFVHSLKSKYNVPLFPRGGVHWNELAIADAMRMVVKDINEQAGRTLVPPFTFSYAMSSTMTNAQDHELTDVLNIFLPLLNDKTPSVSFQPSASCSNHPASRIKAAVIGGSFMNVPSRILATYNCLTELRHYYYLVGGIYGGQPYGTIQRHVDDKSLAPLRDADLLILEENESNVGTTNHVRRLDELLAAAN